MWWQCGGPSRCLSGRPNLPTCVPASSAVLPMQMPHASRPPSGGLITGRSAAALRSRASPGIGTVPTSPSGAGTAVSSSTQIRGTAPGTPTQQPSNMSLSGAAPAAGKPAGGYGRRSMGGNNLQQPYPSAHSATSVGVAGDGGEPGGGVLGGGAQTPGLATLQEEASLDGGGVGGGSVKRPSRSVAPSMSGVGGGGGGEEGGLLLGTAATAPVPRQSVAGRQAVL